MDHSNLFVKKFIKAMSENASSDFSALTSEFEEIMRDDNISADEKLTVLNKINSRQAFDKIDATKISTDSLKFRHGFSTLFYYRLFDESNFSRNECILRWFFESASRIGPERDALLNYCSTIVNNLTTLEKQILVDVLPFCELRDELFRELRRWKVDDRHVKVETYFTDSQSVHHSGIATSVNKNRDFCNSNNLTSNFTEYLNEFTRECPNLSSKQQKAVDYIVKDESSLGLTNAFCHVWERIKISSHKSQLLKILLDELDAMSGTCGSGHLSRLQNVLTGYDDQINVKIGYEDEIKGSFIARYNKAIKDLDQDQRDAIVYYLTLDEKPIEYELFKEITCDTILTELKLEYKSLWDENFTKDKFMAIYLTATDSV
jgi:hypothetical protein